MVDQELKQLMANGLFRIEGFEQIWGELNQMYETLGFKDEISDETRIAEYKYITQQLRKYMSTKEPEVLGQDDLLDMIAVIEDLINRQKEYGDTRQDIVYNFMRDHWLVGVHSVLSQMAMGDVEDEEEDE